MEAKIDQLRVAKSQQEARIEELEEENTELTIDQVEKIPECPVNTYKLYFAISDRSSMSYFPGLSRSVQEGPSHLQLPRWSSHLWNLQGQQDQQDQGKKFIFIPFLSLLFQSCQGLSHLPAPSQCQCPGPRFREAGQRPLGMKRHFPPDSIKLIEWLVRLLPVSADIIFIFFCILI